tara:strand:+ start:9700 stop:10428 length:729 start_codon:yes stop_codon:yes gene_type:complete
MAKINKNIFKPKNKDTIVKGVNLSKGYRAGKKAGMFALGLITKIHPVARVASLLYKTGRALHLRHQARNLKLVTDTMLRRTPIRGNVVIQPFKGTKITKRAKIVRTTPLKYLSGIKRTRATNQKLLTYDRKIPGGTMKPADYRPLNKPKITTNRSIVTLARKRRALRQEAGTGIALKIGIGLGAYKGGKRLTQTKYGALPLDSTKARQNLILSTVRKPKVKKYRDSNLTQDQMDSIFKRLKQ